MRVGLTFDDVLIVPKYSDIETRENIDLSQDFLGAKLEIPIISANMDYVTGPLMAYAMAKNGGLGILHRFMPWSNSIGDEGDQITGLSNLSIWTKNLAFSVGTRDLTESMRRVRIIEDRYPQHNIIVCIDVAHGDHSKVVQLIAKIKNYNSRIQVIAGNIAKGDALDRLALAGADAIKVGIGPGSACTTRIVTGVGVPQLTAIMDAAKAARGHEVKIIADGGIKTSGDIVKALAAGANAVMLGNILAGADECPGATVEIGDGRTFKPYRGQSMFGSNGERYVKEGVSGYVETKGPVAGILRQMVGGIKSGLSYVGAKNLAELQENAEFIQITSNGLTESHPRIGVL